VHKNFCETNLGIPNGPNAQLFGANWQDKPSTIPNPRPMQPSARDAHCAAPLEADAPDVVTTAEQPFPTSELLAVALGLSAVAVYVVAGLALVTFWFWQ
jgi:hypothetical protein